MDEPLIAMVAPNRETTCTADGTPYRAGSGTLIHVQARHVAELKARGFRLVPSTWSVTPPVMADEAAAAEPETAPTPEKAAPTAAPPPRRRKRAS